MNQALASGSHFAIDYAPYAKAMWFLLTVPPAVGMMLAVIPTLKYEITADSHEKMLAALVERHSKADEQ